MLALSLFYWCTGVLVIQKKPYTQSHTGTQTHTRPSPCWLIHSFTHMLTHRHTFTHIYSRAYMHTRTYTHTLKTHTHAHIQSIHVYSWLRHLDDKGTFRLLSVRTVTMIIIKNNHRVVWFVPFYPPRVKWRGSPARLDDSVTQSSGVFWTVK